MNDLINSSDLKRFVPALAFVLIGGAAFSAVNAGAGDFAPLPVGRVPFADGRHSRSGPTVR